MFSASKNDVPVIQKAKDLLAQHPDFRGIPFDFDYENPILTVNGSLSTYYLKQVLQTELAKIDSHIRVQNRVRVLPNPDANGIGQNGRDRSS